MPTKRGNSQPVEYMKKSIAYDALIHG
jgi:hypothetical protein